MTPQTKIRLEKMKGMLEGGKTLEIGVINHRITGGVSLDCNKDYNPDILHDLNNGKIPLEDNSFNVIVAGEVLEHLLDVYNVTSEFYRILEDNGVLILSVPNISSLVSRIKGLFGFLPTSCSLPAPSSKLDKHVNDFNKREIKKVLKQANFKVEKITSNGLIFHRGLITRFIPASMGETLIIKARKIKL